GRQTGDLVAAAGFTATDEFSLASGCDPSPDPKDWAGYERFFPECLLGSDLLTAQPRNSALRSFADAHAAGTLVDKTIDMPRSTSDQYLECWADTIELSLDKDSNRKPEVRKALIAYRRTVDGLPPKVSDPAFRARQDQFRQFVENMSSQDQSLAQLLASGTRAQLEKALDPSLHEEDSTDSPAPQTDNNQQMQMPEMTPRRRGPRGSRRAWQQTVRPAWKAAVLAGQITNLSPPALTFEKYLLGQEDHGRNFVSDDGRAIMEEVYWQSGYFDPQIGNPSIAQAVARWGAERRDYILAWARASKNTDVRSAADRLAQRWTTPPAEPESPGISRDVAAERTLFYRRVL